MRSRTDLQQIESYCDVLWQWLDLVVDRVTLDGASADPHLKAVAEASTSIRVAVSKSSYLARRLYEGEQHRTEPCPVHQGRWSGLAVDRPSCGCDMTGWLPPTMTEGR